MGKNMRVRSPSNSEVAWFGNDTYSTLREYCTCPECKVVWTHLESGNWKADWAYARENYSRETQCMECGLITEAIPKQTFRESLRGEYRRTVDRVPDRAPAPEEEEER